jgi:hypothetical protein
MTDALAAAVALALIAAAPSASHSPSEPAKGSPAYAPRSPEEAALLSVDVRQRTAVANADLAAIAAISHPNLRVNAPTNRILTRESLIAMVGSGDIRNEVFERTPEDVQITGDVGVVMGREVVFPGAASEQARVFGQRTLTRRYTNVYLREGGEWRHLARHANVVAAP